MKFSGISLENNSQNTAETKTREQKGSLYNTFKYQESKTQHSTQCAFL